MAEKAGELVADRFLVNAQAGFNALLEQPHLGSPLSLRRLELVGVRKWQVRGFGRVLIFYLPQGDDVSILRVLHASSGWWSLFGIDDEGEDRFGEGADSISPSGAGPEER